MATNNPTDHYHGSVHPQEMLEAFALDALDLHEEERVRDHLDNCDLCSAVVDNYQETTAALAGSVNPQDPPPSLRGRLMQAISRELPATPDAPQPQLVPSFGDRLKGSKLVRGLVPMAASVAMVLVVLAVAMNVRTSNQIDDLKRENASLQASLDSSVATMTAQISEATVAESRVMNTVLQLQQASYELARPDNMSLELHSPYAGSRAQGILLVSRDGSSGVIMVAGMDPPSPSTSYDVWLMRGRTKMWVGQVGVDSRGWGTVSLQLPESIMGFEKVELTASAGPNAGQPPTDMVLEGNLVSMNAPRLVNYAAWR